MDGGVSTLNRRALDSLDDKKPRAHRARATSPGAPSYFRQTDDTPGRRLRTANAGVILASLARYARLSGCAGDRRGEVVESLVAHFLNVGHGDCTFIELPSGRLMMIDINNSKSLPETDKEALAARKGLSVREFAGHRPAAWAAGRGRSTTSRCWSTPTSTTRTTSAASRSSATCKPTPTWTTCPDCTGSSGRRRSRCSTSGTFRTARSSTRTASSHGPYRLPGLAHLPAAAGGTRPEGQRRHVGQSPRHQEHQARQRPVLDRRRHPGLLPDARADRRVRRQRGVQRLLLRHQAQLRRPEHHPSRRCRGASLEVDAR